MLRSKGEYILKSFQIDEHKNGVLIFTITRQNKRNAVDYEVMEGLKEAIEWAKNPNIKVLVVTGEGDQAFCSGGDLSIFHELKTEDQAYQMLSKMGNILYELLMLPKPTIALMNGTAVGGGCEIATACDFRIAHKNIQAGFVQGNLAITTGWGGGTILLEKLPLTESMKMLIEAKKHSVDELLQIGFIQSVYEGEHMDGLQQFLTDILSKETGVLSAYKEMATRKWRESNIEDRIVKEIRNCAILWESEAHHNEVEKFVGNKN